jgi:hypothetical protein
VAAAVRGRFDARSDESVRECLLVFTVIDKCFDIGFDFIVDISDQKQFLDA